MQKTPDAGKTPRLEGKRPVGRPPGSGCTYTEEKADKIVSELSKGIPLAQICRENEEMPDRCTVYAWMEANDEFAQRITRARACGFDAIADECLEIADDDSEDVIETESGPRVNAEFVARSKVRIETRLKLLAKWDPKRYGDKIDHTVKSEVKTTSEMVLSPETAEAMRAMLANTEAKK